MLHFYSMPSALIQLRHYLFVSLIGIVCFGCKFDDHVPNKTSFKKVTHIYYTEVRRTFDSGLAFNRYGYQLEPIWRLMFYSDSLANVYSPDKKRFLNFPVIIDRDSIFNVSGTYLKAINVTKDSLILQVLKVVTKKVYWAKSNVYMTLYADNYIKNVLHKDPRELKKLQKRDSLFIFKRIAEVNANPDSSFAAREPVVFKSKSPLVSIVKEKPVVDLMGKTDITEYYMYPEYTITINKAYNNFSYSIVAIVDTQGQLHFQKSLLYMYPDFRESTIHTIKAIMDGYLKAYLQVTPGTTLNIPHSSAITLNLVGKKG